MSYNSPSSISDSSAITPSSALLIFIRVFATSIASVSLVAFDTGGLFEGCTTDVGSIGGQAFGVQPCGFCSRIGAAAERSSGGREVKRPPGALPRVRFELLAGILKRKLKTSVFRTDAR